MKFNEVINYNWQKLKYIGRLIISTPNYGWIIVLQFLSGVFSIIGLPLLIPVLKFMQNQGNSLGQAGLMVGVESMLQGVGIQPNFSNLLLIAAVLIILGETLVFVSSYIAVVTQTKVSARYRKDIFQAYALANWPWLLDSRSGEINHAVIKQADWAGVAHLDAQRVLIYFVQVTVFLIIAVNLSVMVTVLALAVYGLLGLFCLYNSHFMQKISKVFDLEHKKLSNNLMVLQQNKKFLKTSMLNEKLTKDIDVHIEEIETITNKQNLLLQAQQSLWLIVTVMFLVGLMYFHQSISLEHSALMLTLVVFLRLSPQFTKLATAYTALDIYIPIHQSLKQSLKDLDKNEETNGLQRFPANQAIRFEDVGFQYPNGTEVFKELNVVIEPKKTTAFVGQSGVGKSTLLDLILRLQDPQAGKILYGNIVHNELDKKSIRKKIAYVTQETTLIDGSLKENITIGVEDYKEQKLNDIIAKIGLSTVVEDLPQGIDTNIGENGIKLSGGQRQRVALARALFMDPEILILDEATSSLDPESEVLIQETIKNLQKDFTIVIVTHKLGAVRCADQIYVLDQGKACESGNYQQLMEQKGKFHLLESLI